jgi:hypothetical protein
MIINETSLRASTFYRFPGPFPGARPKGEPIDVTRARVATWRSLGQEQSLDWNRVVELAEQGGIVVGEGAFLESANHANHVALQLIGTYRRDSLSEAEAIRIDVAGGHVDAF